MRGMSALRRIIRDEKGITLVMPLFALAIISILGMTIMSLTVSNYKMVKADSSSQAAYYIAEAGINKTISDIKIKVNELNEWKKGALGHEDFFQKLDKYIKEDLDPLLDNFKDYFGEKPKATITIVEAEEEVINSGSISEKIKTYNISSTGQIDKSKRTVATSITISHKIEREVEGHPAFDYVLYSDTQGTHINIGSNNKIYGSIYSNHHVKFKGNNNTVEGDIYAKGKIDVGDGNIINGNIYPSGDFPNNPSMLPLSDKFLLSYKSGDTDKGQGQISPGEYGTLTLNKGQSVEFTEGGNYYFKNIDASNQDITLKFNLSSGPVNIVVSGNVNFGRNLKIYAFYDGKEYDMDELIKKDIDLAKDLAGKIYWQIKGEFRLSSNNYFPGTILTYGKNEKIELSSGIKIIGGFATNTNNLKDFDNVTIVYAPPNGTAAGIGEGSGDGNEEIIKSSQATIKKVDPIKEI